MATKTTPTKEPIPDQSVFSPNNDENVAFGVRSPSLRSSVKKNRRPLGDRSVNIVLPNPEAHHGFKYIGLVAEENEENKGTAVLNDAKNVQIACKEKDERVSSSKETSKETVPVGDKEVLKWMVKKLKIQNKELEEEISEHQDSILKLKSEKNKADSSLEATIKLVEDVKAAAQQKDCELHSLQNVYHSAQLATREMKLVYDKEIVNLRNQINLKSMKLEEVEAMLSEASLKLNHAEELVIEELSNQLRLQHHLELAQFVAERTMNQSKLSLQKLENELNKEKEDKLMLVKKNSNIISQMKEANNQLIMELNEKHLKNEINIEKMHKSEIVTMERLISEKCEKIGEVELSLREVNEQLRNTLDQLTTQSNQHEKRVHTLLSQSDQLQIKLETKSLEFKQLSNSYFNLSVEKKNLDYKTKQLEDHISHLESINYHYNSLIDKYKFNEVKTELTKKFQQSNFPLNSCPPPASPTTTTTTMNGGGERSVITSNHSPAKSVVVLVTSNKGSSCMDESSSMGHTDIDEGED
jgi:hypothetical protein